MEDSSKVSLDRIDELITKLENIDDSLAEINNSFTNFKTLTNEKLDNFQQTIDAKFVEIDNTFSTMQTTMNNKFTEIQTLMTNNFTQLQTSLNSQITTVNNKINNMIYITETGKSGNQWYRKWSDGWLEQGGFLASYNNTITFLKSFSNTTYTAICTHNGNTAKGEGLVHCYNKKTTGMNTGLSTSTSGMYGCSWYCTGF